jgi:Polyketide cyclase / dehydrase and lipid transport
MQAELKVSTSPERASGYIGPAVISALAPGRWWHYRAEWGTIGYMSVPGGEGRLIVAAEAVTSATAEAIWPLISDATRYSQWGPWSASGYRGDATTHRPGVVYWLRSEKRFLGRYVTSVERVEEIDEARRVAYTVVGGLPVRDYQAEILLTPSPAGTRIQWSASWDKTALGQMALRGLRPFFPRAVTALAAAASSTSPST